MSEQENKMESIGELSKRYAPLERVGNTTSRDERRALLQELVDQTGYTLGKILKRTTGMQTPEDLRFILAAMKNVKANDGAHAFNIVLFQPKI